MEYIHITDHKRKTFRYVSTSFANLMAILLDTEDDLQITSNTHASFSNYTNCIIGRVKLYTMNLSLANNTLKTSQKNKKVLSKSQKQQF